MDVLYIVLLIGGLACFIIEAIFPNRARVGLIAVGLALWILVPLIHALVKQT